MKISLAARVVGAAILFIAVVSLVHVKKSMMPAKAPKLPRMQVTDVDGKKVSIRELYDRPLYIQFLDHREPTDWDLFDRVYNDWGAKNIYYVIITNMDSEKGGSLYRDDQVYVTSDYEEMKRAFAAPSYGTSYLALKGRLVYSVANYRGYENGIKLILLKELDHREYSFANLIASNTNIRDVGWLSQLMDLYDGSKDYCILSLFTSICEGCASAQIVSYLNDVYMTNGNVDVITVLSGDFSDLDIKNMISQLKIRNTVVQAGGKLRDTWDGIRKSFNDQVANNIVILTDKTGKIISFLDPACKTCWATFFGILDGLFRSKGLTHE